MQHDGMRIAGIVCVLGASVGGFALGCRQPVARAGLDGAAGDRECERTGIRRGCAREGASGPPRDAEGPAKVRRAQKDELALFVAWDAEGSRIWLIVQNRAFQTRRVCLNEYDGFLTLDPEPGVGFGRWVSDGLLCYQVDPQDYVVVDAIDLDRMELGGRLITGCRADVAVYGDNPGASWLSVECFLPWSGRFRAGSPRSGESSDDVPSGAPDSGDSG